MNTNFSCPSLGINQSSLFQASCEIACCSLSRNEFAKNPDIILSRYDIPFIGKSSNKSQKTSEICTPIIIICGLLVVLGVGVMGVAIYIAAVYEHVVAAYDHHVYNQVEYWGYNMNTSLSNENYMGIC